MTVTGLLPIVSLFCGSGGLDLGFEKAGFNSVAAYDISYPAIETFNANRLEKVAKYGDISTLNYADIVADIERRYGQIIPRGIIGGPPCQAFSRSNVYPREDDIRLTLPGHFARLAKQLNNHYNHGIEFIVFENVQGLTFEKHREEFERFRFLFDEAGFYLYETLLNARHYGVPQDRPRVFIIGLSKAMFMPDEIGVFPPPLEYEITVHDAFSQAFGSEPWPEPAFFNRNLTEIPFHPNHWTMMPKSAKFHNGMLNEGEIKGRSFRVLAWDKPSWTVAYGHREIHVHPSGKRRLSIYEAMILQGYPHDYVLKGTLSDQVTLVSDAVPPPLAYEIAQSVRRKLDQWIMLPENAG